MLRNNSKNRISCLNIFVCAVWISVSLCMKGLVAGVIRSWSKIGLKIGFIAVNFVSTEKVINPNISTNYNISAISGGAADGHHPAVSFDIRRHVSKKFVFQVCTYLCIYLQCTYLLLCFSGHVFTVPLLCHCYNNSISSGFVKDNPLKRQ